MFTPLASTVNTSSLHESCSGAGVRSHFWSPPKEHSAQHRIRAQCVLAVFLLGGQLLPEKLTPGALTSRRLLCRPLLVFLMEEVYVTDTQKWSGMESQVFKVNRSKDQQEYGDRSTESRYHRRLLTTSEGEKCLYNGKTWQSPTQPSDSTLQHQ